MKYTKELMNGQYIFKDLKNDIKVIFQAKNNDYSSDILYIEENYSIDFIKYIIDELVNKNKLGVIISKVDSKDIIELLDNYSIKLANSEYIISYIKTKEIDNIKIIDKLNQELKEYYLNKLNDEININIKYYNPSLKNKLYNKNIFNTDYNFDAYYLNNKFIGIVDYKIVDNKICIRSIFTDYNDDKITIINDLINRYKLDIIITCTYTNNDLKNIIYKLNGKFNYSLFNLIK